MFLSIFFKLMKFRNNILDKHQLDVEYLVQPKLAILEAAYVV